MHEAARGVCGVKPRKSCVLLKAQSIWVKAITPMLEPCIRYEMGFKQTASAPCLYYSNSEGKLLAITIYVILGGN